MVSNGGWSRRFDDPVRLPDGRKRTTQCDAPTCITTLPKAEHDAEAWQTGWKCCCRLLSETARRRRGQTERAAVGGGFAAASLEIACDAALDSRLAKYRRWRLVDNSAR